MANLFVAGVFPCVRSLCVYLWCVASVRVCVCSL
jgi:hypothetical protein